MTHYDWRESEAEAAACAQMEYDQAHHNATQSHQGAPDEASTDDQSNIRAINGPIGNTRGLSEKVQLPL